MDTNGIIGEKIAIESGFVTIDYSQEYSIGYECKVYRIRKIHL